MQDDLERIRQWAQEKTQGGSEPPWAWFQYMKLVETIDAILDGMASTSSMESSPQSDEHQESGLQLVDSTFQPDAPRRRRVGLPVQMPM